MGTQLSLARQYRPKRFRDLIGQEELAQSLSNLIARGNPPDAVLLSGPPGVGKTTTARLIAMALNCEFPILESQSPEIEPCGTCRSCTAIALDMGSELGCFELNAAHYTGIEAARYLNQRLSYHSFGLRRHEVVLLDEVHRFTSNAFAAILKIMEEPPSGVTFVLCTTELGKIPKANKSRCNRYELKPVLPQKLLDLLIRVASEEGREIHEDALRQIAETSDGSVRDALIKLEQEFSLLPDDSTDRPSSDLNQDPSGSKEQLWIELNSFLENDDPKERDRFVIWVAENYERFRIQVAAEYRSDGSV